jgi:hypothetical protein
MRESTQAKAEEINEEFKKSEMQGRETLIRVLNDFKVLQKKNNPSFDAAYSMSYIAFITDLGNGIEEPFKKQFNATIEIISEQCKKTA